MTQKQISINKEILLDEEILKEHPFIFIQRLLNSDSVKDKYSKVGESQDDNI